MSGRRVNALKNSAIGPIRTSSFAGCTLAETAAIVGIASTRRKPTSDTFSSRLGSLARPN